MERGVRDGMGKIRQFGLRAADRSNKLPVELIGYAIWLVCE